MTKRVPQVLFELNVVADNPLYEGFALEEAPSLIGRDSLDDDITPAFEVDESVRKWKQPSLADRWKPPKVIGRVAPFNDFPGVDGMLPAFSRRACDALRDFLEPNGELLPLDSDVGEFYLYNITRVVDALDFEKSDGDFFDDERARAVSIDHFVFHEKKLAGLSIFRIYEWPMGTIVAEEFAQRCHEHGLNGFNFVKLWPFKRGVNWHVAGRSKKQRAKGKNLKQHTFVLIFSLAGKKPKAAENKVLARFEDELDAQLTVSSLDAPFFGWYEGRDTVDAEVRLFLSCPDVDALARKLQPWLQNLDWPHETVAVKRYGDLYDTDAKETFIPLR